MRRLLPALTATFVLVANPADAQIVNTLGGWADTTLGWTGRIGATADLNGGNTDVQSLAAAGRIQWQDVRYRVRFLGSLEVEDANDVRAKEESLLHLRGVLRLSPSVLPFAFVQVQRNPFTRLETRWLFGAGAEWILTPHKPWTLAMGASPMLEVEKLEADTTGTATRGRFSTFLRLEASLGDRSRWTALGFYQPRLSVPADFRSSVSSTLDIAVVGRLGALLFGSWEHDDEPPAGVDPDDWELRFGLTFGL